MVERKVKIANPLGLQLRVAGDLCQEAMNYTSKVTFRYGIRQNVANAKSILSVLGAGVTFGEEIILSCEGEDEAEAIGALANLLECGIGE